MAETTPNTKHILVVDDDPVIAVLTARALDTYNVRVARNGHEALQLASTLPACDLLITDYLMPSISGDELAGLLRARWPSLRTLLVTGFAGIVAADGGSPVDVCLSKPLKLPVLRQTVLDLIGPAESISTAPTEAQER